MITKLVEKPNIINFHDFDEILIYSTPTAIIEYNTVEEVKTTLVEFKKPTDSIVSFDLDYSLKCLFWYEWEQKEIKKKCDKNDEAILHEGVENVTDLRVDWINKNLYWISADKIERSNYNGESRIVMKNGTKKTNLLTLDPSKSLIYWNSYDEGKKSWFIVRSSIIRDKLDDAELEVETKNEINSLVVFDHLPYFTIDKKLSYADMDTNTIIHPHLSENILEVMLFAVSDQRIYYYNEKNNGLEYLVNSNITNLHETIPNTNENVNRFLLYGPGSQAYDRHNCLFSDNYTCLLMCSNIEPSCSAASNIYMDRKMKDIAISSDCSFHQYKCSNNKCISMSQVCNDEDDCLDADINKTRKSSDEANCDSTQTTTQTSTVTVFISVNTIQNVSISEEKITFNGTNSVIQSETFDISFKSILLTSLLSVILILFMILTISYYIITRKKRFKCSSNYHNLNHLPFSQISSNSGVANSVNNSTQNMGHDEEPLIF